MNGYLDSSVLLRILLNQPRSLPGFSEIQRPVSSKLLKTECLRALDRARLQRHLAESEHLIALKELHECLESVEWITVSEKVLERAGMGLPVALGTLDAIHLASAILWREETAENCTFLTHDRLLKDAALALGFSVLG